ncbi:MAG: diaminopimelate decarboxylase [Spirochaetales bacterium]|nr:diaminopimelate decarboxylase [Spirochaetales bacterium]
MTQKSLPFTKADLERITDEYETPFHIYDEQGIRENARRFLKAFDWVPGGFKNFFAVKALPNPNIVKLLMEEGMGADCSSLPELEIAHMAGIKGEGIMFTSNDTPAREFQRAKELGAVINLDDESHIDYLEAHAGMPELICFRYNPGSRKEGNSIIGNPTDAKYGFTHEQIIEGYVKARALGARRFGLHTMVASNELNPDYFVETADLLFDLALEINEKTGIVMEFVNLGGGIGIPYKPEQTAVDLEYVSGGIKARYDQKIRGTALEGMRIVMECGRMVTGPYGYLVSKVIHRKDTYKTFIGLDSCMANLMRPALYGAYHHITVPGKEDAPLNLKADVTGSLCENNDKFAIDRMIPDVETGDFLVIHDTGAHGHAMGFNYNAKLRSAELLLKSDGSVALIRRAETMDDYMATVIF